MKKNFALFIFIFLSPLNLVAQDLKIELQNIRTEEKVLNGIINDKYTISMYLKLYDFSEDHMRIYSVKGWYHYGNVQKKIPLVGIYDGHNGELTLYSFKTKEQENKVLNFESQGTVWEIIEILKNLSAFNEKFVYSDDDKTDNQWTDGKKKLKLEFYDSDTSIFDEYQFLNIKSKEVNKNIKMSDLAIYDSNFELINYVKNQNDVKILLKFEYTSRFNIQGMCGGGLEIGYILLSYDNNFNLINIQREEIESCLNMIGNEEIKTSSKHLKKFKITDREEKSKTITIDENLIEIKVE